MRDMLASSRLLRSRLRAVRKERLRPPPRLSVDQWADQYRILPSETSAITGRWRTSNYEVARGPLRAVTEPGIRTITGVASAQLFKTSMIENVVGMNMHLTPCPMLIFEPTDDTASALVQSKLDPMIRATPQIAAVFGGVKELDKKNDKFTKDKKSFHGGYVEILTAGSVANLGMRSARIVMFDEVDKMNVTRDGDVISLGEERLKGFEGAGALSIRVSTPTVTGASRIMSEYERSDMRKPYVSCPHCGEEHYLKWEQIQFKNDAGVPDPDIAAYYCEGCGCEITDAERVTIMTTEGAIVWRQTQKFTCCGEKQEPDTERLWDEDGKALCKHCGERGLTGSHAGFWAWEAYHPRVSTKQLVQIWLDCRGDRDKIRNFVNSRLARTFADNVEEDAKIDVDSFAARVEPPFDEVPADAKVITIGVDVQSGANGRLEAEVVAWGDGEESWSLDYHVIQGDPDEPDVWAALDEIRTRAYVREDGAKMNVQAVCIDTGGHNFDAVTSYCAARQKQRVWAIKGASETGAGVRKQIWPLTAPSTVRNGAKLHIVGTHAAKDSIASAMSVTDPGPRYMHVPAGRVDSWFEQMTNEKRIVIMKDNRRISTWKPVKEGARTEALDCRVYARAALEGLRRKGLKLLAPTAAALVKNAQPEGDQSGAKKNIQIENEAAENPEPRTPPPVRRKKRPRMRNNGNLWD